MLTIIFRRLLLWSNIFLAVLLLLSAFLTYLNPGKYRLAGFAGFFFPALFLVCLAFIPVWWLWKRKKYMLISLIAGICCIHAAMVTWGIHFFRDNNTGRQKGNGQFTLMTYNSSSMGLASYKRDQQKETAIYDVIKKAAPDILCIQEFYSNDQPEMGRHIENIRKEGGYRYHFFTCDKMHWETWYYGIVLFSRFPIASAAAIPCGKSEAGSGSSFLQADIIVGEDTIRVFSVQLTSYMFRGDDYDNMKAPVSTGLIDKMQCTFPKRAGQALQLAGLIAQSPYPVIVCGDFNDTPVSFTYKTISKGLQDVFLETGSGWGRTLSYLSPSLRIDYILPQQAFHILAGEVMQLDPSEHFPVMARLSLKKH